MTSLSTEEITKLLNEVNETIKNEKCKTFVSYSSDIATLKSDISKIKESHEDFYKRICILELKIEINKLENAIIKQKLNLM
jgi:hypothetical protein